jgi:hypothetical protein
VGGRRRQVNEPFSLLEYFNHRELLYTVLYVSFYVNPSSFPPHRLTISQLIFNDDVTLRLLGNFLDGDHTKHVNIKSTTVYVPSSELGLSHPLSRPRVCTTSPQTRGGGAHWPAGGGLGESQFPRLEKKLSTLPTL